MQCIITVVKFFFLNSFFVVVIRIFSYPDMFTEKSCPLCPDKWISTVLIWRRFVLVFNDSVITLPIFENPSLVITFSFFVVSSPK